MFEIYWGEQHIVSCQNNHKEEVSIFCADNDINYEISEIGNYHLFPVLKGVTVALSPLGESSERPDNIVKHLSEKLLSFGALVLYVDTKKKSNALLKIMKVQIILSFKEKKNKDKTGIKLFYSLKEKEKSQRVLATVIKKMLSWGPKAECEVAGYFDMLKNPQYYRWYCSEIPTVLVEINRCGEIELRKLEKAIIEGMLEIYGDVPYDEQEGKVNALKVYIVENNKKREEIEQERLKAEALKVIEEERLEQERLEQERLEKEATKAAEEEKLPEKKQKAKRKGIPANAKNNSIHTKKHRNTKKAVLFPPDDAPFFRFVAGEQLINSRNSIFAFNDSICTAVARSGFSRSEGTTD